jgi:hypothetical protein
MTRTITQEDLRNYTGRLAKSAITYRAELTKNPFDVNALQNLTKLDIMFVEVISKYLNQ